MTEHSTNESTQEEISTIQTQFNVLSQEISMIKTQFNELIEYIHNHLVRNDDISHTIPGYNSINAGWQKGYSTLKNIKKNLPSKFSGGKTKRQKDKIFKLLYHLYKIK